MNINYTYAAIGASVILIGIIISKYNGLNKNKNQIENAISALDALFIKRAELIPNLVNVVKQYMKFEEETLTKITAMRSSNAKSDQNLEKEGKEAMKKMLIQVENYPDLKASEQFTNLQYSWNEVEEQISAGRRYVSSSITVYNNSVTTFPSNLIAKITGFKKYEWQYATESQREKIDSKQLFDQA